MTTWRNRIKSLTWRKIISEKTQAKIVEIYSTLLKYIKPVIKKIQKTTIYKKIEHGLSKISKKNKTIIGIAIVVIVLLFGYNLIFNGKHDTYSSQELTPVSKLEKGTPGYATVLPQGKTIESLGGWTKVSPPKSSPVYTYIDRVEKVQINVSEQPLPDSFKSDASGKLEQLAQNEKATEKITVGDNTVYISTSSQGPQSLFLIKNNLLILIKSDSTVSEDSWIKYINSLQ